MNVLLALSRVIADISVAGLWQGMVLIALVAAGLRIVPRLGAAGRFWIWGLAFLAAVALPFVRFADAAHGSGVRLRLGWGVAIAACWALLMIARMTRLARQGLQLRSIWKQAVPLDGGLQVADLLTEMPRRPLLCTSTAVDAPSVIGFWAPKLLIPKWQAANLTEMELRQIVLHECEHLRRGDDWINLAQKVGIALFPLNPALLWADRRLSLERELACDAGVVARTRAPFDYARCLTRLAEQRLGRTTLALTLSAWGRQSELVKRVHRLLRPGGSMGLVPQRMSVGLLAAIVAWGGLELARVPRLVSFADLAPQTAVVQELSSDAASSAGGRMVPVVYREPAPNASMAPRPQSARRTAAAKQPGRVRTMPRLVRTVSTENQTAFVFPSSGVRTTRFQVSLGERDALRMTDAVVTDLPASYAAVPFANGWLILQL